MKVIVVFTLLSIGFLAWKEASSHVRRTLNHPMHVEVHMGTNWDFPPTVNCQFASESSLKKILQAQANLQMITASANSSLQPYERLWARTIQLSHSWIPDSVWDNDFFHCCCKQLSFAGICYRETAEYWNMLTSTIYLILEIIFQILILGLRKLKWQVGVFISNVVCVCVCELL